MDGYGDNPYPNDSYIMYTHYLISTFSTTVFRTKFISLLFLFMMHFIMKTFEKNHVLC